MGELADIDRSAYYSHAGSCFGVGTGGSLTCKYCGCRELKWKQISRERYRLAHSDGPIHSCDEYREKKQEESAEANRSGWSEKYKDRLEIIDGSGICDWETYIEGVNIIGRPDLGTFPSIGEAVAYIAGLEEGSTKNDIQT